MNRTLPLVAALLVAGCLGANTATEPHRDCTLAAALSDLAGPAAKDCGRVEVDGDASEVDACVVAAFRAGMPFGAVYELQGIDSNVSSALASDGETVWFLYRDSDPSGGSEVGAVITRSVCIGPVVEIGEDGHEVVGCTESSGCGELVCAGGDTGLDCVD